MRSISARAVVSLSAMVALLTLPAGCRRSPGAPPVPSRLAMLTFPPGSTLAGQVIGPPIEVAVQSSNGSTVTTDTHTVTIAIQAGTGAPGATLGGTVTRTTVNGIARFDDLVIERAGSGYRLVATASANGQALEPATSNPFTIMAGSASRLAFTAPPPTTVAGTPFPQPVQVTVTDDFGNLVQVSNIDVTVAIEGIVPASGDSTAPLRFTRSGTTVTPINPLAGTLTAEVFAGIATFSNLRPRRSGDYDVTNDLRPRLVASAPGLASATSARFTVTPAPVSRTWVSVPPCFGTGCLSPFPPMDQQRTGEMFVANAWLLDSLDNRTNAGANEVTLALQANPGGATLSATSITPMTNGRKIFHVTLDNPGNGYTIVANASGLTPVPSFPFNVVAGTSQWQPVDSLPEARNSMFATTVGTKIYVAAGSAGFPNFLSSVRVFDPFTNTWSSLRAASTARAFSATNSAQVNGVLHLVAGNPSGSCTTTHEAYTVATDAWTSLAAAPRERCHAVAVAHDGKVYVVGGWNTSSTVRYAEVDVYTPGTNAWTSGVALPTGTFRGGMAAVVHNAKLYLIGGTISTSDACTNTVAVLDFAAGTWGTAASMSMDRCSPAAVVAQNGRIYVAGGSNDSGVATASVESYDPATNTWRSEPAMSVARQGLALVRVNDLIYAMGGSSGSVSFRLVEFLLVP